MIAAKTPLQIAEEVKKYMVGNGIYNGSYKPSKSERYLYFPATKKDEGLTRAFAPVEYVARKLQKASLHNYKDFLKSKLSRKQLGMLPSSYDMIGDIIIIQLDGGLEKWQKEISAALLRLHKNIKTILKKSGVHEGEFRTQALEYVAGQNKKETTYRENNASIKLDVEKVYFSPRLSTERKRIYQQVKKGENILAMFSGSGVYPLVISKNAKAKKITGIEKNPVAHRYALENIRLNKAENIFLICGDVNEEIPKLTEKFDRILMPLPKGAENFLDIVLKTAKRGTMIHFYDFEKDNETQKAEMKIKDCCRRNGVDFAILRTVKCGQYSPGKFRLCVDFMIK